ncbi:hypothetical protein FBU30_007273 [Linnemannia zychae]|nr:hypothetical protein FBU30_007273 [Linnemannia zychae]
MITLLAHNLPPVSISQTDESGAPLLLRLTHPNHKVQTLIVHSHPTTLHLFNNNKLQSAWSFPHPIVAYCSNTSSNSSHQKQRPLQLEDNGITLVVATQDGSIWNVPLQSPALDSNTTNSSSSGNIKSSTNQTSKSLPKIAIKIEDDDTIVIKDEDEEEEEVELWNDEDGLVVDEAFDALETLLPPANKRQRISSPPIVTTTPHDTAESSYKTHTVNRAHHLIGSEDSVASIFTTPRNTLSHGHKLLVIGTNGVISWSEIPEYVQDSFPVAPKSLSLDTNAQHAFITRTHLYILNEIGQVVRLPTEQLELTTSKDLEIMSLPLLCALSPITSHDSRSFDGLHARPQRLVETRETVGRALSELERLSDQIKQLEVQCQLENQRITTYNRLTPWTLDFELDREMVSSLPLQVSIGLLFREFEHDRTSMTIAKEEGIFSAYFVVDDLDLDILDFVEGVEDPLLYEIPAPVQRLPSFPSTAITNTTLHYNNKSLDNSNDGHNDEGQEEEKSCVQCTNENGNLFGPDIKAATSHASAFQPIEFEIDTASIPPSQCLSALFFQEDNEISCRKSIKVIDMTALRRTTISTTTAIATVTTTQACFRTCFILPGECLSSFRRASAVCHYFGPTTQQQRQQQHQQTRHQQPYNPGKRFNTVDELKRQVSWRTSEEILVAADQIEDSEFKMVWVDLEVEQLSNKDRDEENKRKGLHQAQDYTKQQHQQQQMQQPQEEHEGLVRAHVLVRGSDPERVFAVHQTLEKRIHELF